MKLGIIGVGAIGSVLAARLLKANKNDLSMVICDLDKNKLNQFADYDNVTVTEKIAALDGCDIVFIAVKPKAVTEVLIQLEPLNIPCLLSIAAGVSLEELERYSSKALVRAMPNTPCAIGEGICVVTFGDKADINVREQVKQILTSLGEVEEIDEQFFSVVTAISGSGPAYVYLIIEALIDAGCAHGLTREVAKKLVVSTFIGSSKMVQTSDVHPAMLKDQVTSPGGVTIKALEKLETSGLRGILWNAVNAAVKP